MCWIQSTIPTVRGQIRGKSPMKKLPNDIGGLPAGPVNPIPHDPELWEKRLTALVASLGPLYRGVIRIDEFRRSRESIPEDFYNSLTYFELWTQGIANLLVEKEVLSHADIEIRMREIKNH
jgi:hypothetical protein